MSSVFAHSPIPLHKILVANRGEIALRILRSAREAGLQTVAVYSEADRHAPHVRWADEAYAIGPAPSSASYLRGDAIISLALEKGCQAIHPGYGFLSDTADFAEAVDNAGLVLMGPSSHSIRTMGNKVAAKQAVAGFDIPLVPGTDHPVADPGEALAIAQQIGFPLLIKAAAGGGGKGMRIVQRAEDLEESLNTAISEARSAFGDGSVFIEKYLENPRHIEIQILADAAGNTVHLFERECSIQRRHQKLIEEAPSSCLGPELREKMGQAAVRVAQACQYRNAGTVEFLLDRNQSFYFLEMNTRLQVEHPVTECITGLDLVHLQLQIAAGEALPFEQKDLRIQGHSLELRLCAEDPRHHFLPDLGTLTRFRPPQGPGVRLDSGYEEGMEIPVHYDPLMAKLIVHAPNRPAALARMRRALDEFELEGLASTLEFGRWVMDQPAFVEGQFDTGFIAQYFRGAESLDSTVEPSDWLALSAMILQKQPVNTPTNLPSEPDLAWDRLWNHRTH
ncbi:MAG: acetyl-CoA carboxylase biotin carboxylase subunit [Bacteroidia bacterium]